MYHNCEPDVYHVTFSWLIEPRAHKYWRNETRCGQCDLERLIDPRIVVSTWGEYYMSTCMSQNGAGEKRQDEKGARIARKRMRRRRMRCGSKIITDKVSR